MWCAQLRRRDLLRAAPLIDSWRWAGVPFYLRSGKCIAGDGDRGDGRAEALAAAAVRGTPRPNPGSPTTCASAVPPPGPSRSPRGSSCPARSTSATAGALPLRAPRRREAPYERCWATPWPATARSSPARTRWSRRGPSSIPTEASSPRARIQARDLGPKQANSILEPA